MPIYEYACPGCGREFQKRVSMSSADERQDCPHCGGTHARRQLSLIARSAPSGGSSRSFSSSGSCGPVG